MCMTVNTLIDLTKKKKDLPDHLMRSKNSGPIFSPSLKAANKTLFSDSAWPMVHCPFRIHWPMLQCLKITYKSMSSHCWLCMEHLNFSSVNLWPLQMNEIDEARKAIEFGKSRRLLYREWVLHSGLVDHSWLLQ